LDLYCFIECGNSKPQLGALDTVIATRLNVDSMFAFKDPDLCQLIFIQRLRLFWAVFWAVDWVNIKGLLMRWGRVLGSKSLGQQYCPKGLAWLTQ